MLNNLAELVDLFVVEKKKNTSFQISKYHNQKANENMKKQCMESTGTFVVSSPLGDIYVVICSNGLHSLSQCQTITDDNFDPDLRQPICLLSKPQYCNHSVNKHVDNCVDWLKSYFNEKESSKQKHSKDVSLPSLCCMEIGDIGFRERVWLKLAKNVGPGKTITYGSLAALVNSPGAARAVGTAMAQNPFQLIVPCHRVIRSDLNVGNYASGKKNKVKRWLLQFEGIEIDSKSCVKSCDVIGGNSA